jgi:hypothetical protein
MHGDEHDEWLFNNDGVRVRVPLAAPVISQPEIGRNARVRRFTTSFFRRILLPRQQ